MDKIERHENLIDKLTKTNGILCKKNQVIYLLELIKYPYA